MLKVAGVERWEDLKGQTVRVAMENDGWDAKSIGIGHIVKDEWFMLTEFKAL